MTQSSPKVQNASQHHAIVDTTRTKPKRILQVVANPTKSSTIGWPVGFWASELTHTYYAFIEAGYE